MPTISTTIIPISSNDLNRPGAGVENWNGQDYADVPASGQRFVRLDNYFRFVWTDIEKVTQGNYVWTRFDQEFQKAINNGAKFSFGIFMVNDSDDFLAYETFAGSGAWARYPKYVHDRMQTESVKDYVTNDQWIPAWNSQFMLDRFQALLIAVRDHIISKGWQNAVGYIDIRGYGQWGEWHSVGFGDPVSSMPSGIRPTVATYKRLVDMHITAFPDWQLVMLMAALDAEWLNNTLTPKEVTDYILKAKNNVGLIGIRRDQWGAPDNYIKDTLENNTRSFGSSGPFNAIIMDRWKFAPWVGEPMGPGSNLSDLERQVTFYKASSFGNGNYTKGSTTDSQVRAASKAAGYRLQIEGGSFTNTNNSATVTLNWRNAGVAPTYENWNVQLLLKNSSGTVVTQAVSSFKPRLFLPSGSPTAITDTFSFSVPAGTYTLGVRVVDAGNYRKPMPLFINGVQSDGSYNLGTLTVTSGAVNVPPTVTVTGGSITLPTNSFSLTANATDSDGSISAYQWSKISGPTGGTITSPTSKTTTVTVLTTGAYVFQVQVTDNQGAVATANATVVVSPAPNQPPTVSAGSDKVLTLPNNSVTLVGTASDVDGTFTVLWTKVSGSGTISSPTFLSTAITGLTAGTSFFRLTVTDDKGATASDETSITVNNAVNQPPTANAGPDKTLTLPTTSIALNGAASDVDGTFTSTWSKISGEGIISSPNSLSTVVSGFTTQGQSIFRLTVTDDKGATASDDVVVTIAPAASNQSPVANAGQDQKIILPKTTTELNGTASTDTDGFIKTWVWRKVAGPSATLTDTSKPICKVSGLQKGVYIFELRVVDDKGVMGFDQVGVVVEEPSNGIPQKTVTDVNIHTASYKVTYSDGSFEII